MIRQIKENKIIQTILRLSNYFVSIGFIALFFETETMVLNSQAILLFRTIFNQIYTRNIQFFSLVIIFSISLFLLDFKKNKMIQFSFIFNAIISLLLLVVGILFYFAY